MSVRLIVFSDLDGCLLDRSSGSFEPARPALLALQRSGVPLVLCSGKTRAEMEPLAARLGLHTPLVVENGGAIVLPSDPAELEWRAAGRGAGEAFVLPLGVPRARLVEALPLVARDAGVEVRGFSGMSAPEVAALTGLCPADAELALVRDFDEPFLVQGVNGRDPRLDARLDAAARKHGLRVSHGGWLYHLHGPTDKGQGARAVARLYDGGAGRTVGLGDAASDVPLLLAVDRPLLVPGPDGVDPALERALPQAERAPQPGPEGWNAAVLAVLAGRALPRAGA